MLRSCFPAIFQLLSSDSPSLTYAGVKQPPVAMNTDTELLLLGAGWTSTFLLPLLSARSVSTVATTRDGRDGTLRWTFDPIATLPDQFKVLPKAKTVVISFPIKGSGPSKCMVEGYEAVHGKTRWIQLGSSGIWDGGPTLQRTLLDEKKPSFEWTDRHSPYATTNDRAIAEDELLASSSDAFILNLCGLWGGARDPLNWVSRVAPTKEALKSKTSIHLIHGSDVALAILSVHLYPSPASPSLSGRYLITDLRVYCWWDIASSAGAAAAVGAKGDGEGKHSKWVLELMEETGVRALPRDVELLGRGLDSREFWRIFCKEGPRHGRWGAGAL